MLYEILWISLTSTEFAVFIRTSLILTKFSEVCIKFLSCRMKLNKNIQSFHANNCWSSFWWWIRLSAYFSSSPLLSLLSQLNSHKVTDSVISISKLLFPFIYLSYDSWIKPFFLCTTSSEHNRNRFLLAFRSHISGSYTVCRSCNFTISTGSFVHSRNPRVQRAYMNAFHINWSCDGGWSNKGRAEVPPFLTP